MTDSDIGLCRSRTNADDRLPRASLGRVERGDGVGERRDVADVRPTKYGSALRISTSCTSISTIFIFPCFGRRLPLRLSILLIPPCWPMRHPGGQSRIL